METTDSTEQSAVPETGGLFPGSGEAARLIRELDWSETPLGPPGEWPQGLRSATDICLASPFPMVIFWGRELLLVYNDAYLPILGPLKHPHALGQPAEEVWAEIWDVIAPMLHGVLERREATFSDDLLLMIDRDGVQESYFTFSYSPISGGDGGAAGVFCAVTETTERVLGERRLRTLRELSVATGDARSAQEAGRRAVESLAGSRSDIPFASLYLLDRGDGAILEVFGDESPLADDAIARAARQDEPSRLDGLAVQVDLPGVGAATATSALVLPLRHGGAETASAVLVAGISPVRRLDDLYRAFFDLVAGQISTALADARAYEVERERAERLAELDRAKTEFFSNVSHEFRTPLTLLLGPLEDVLAEAEPEAPLHAEIETAHRNALRMLKLVNTLLDFSRIEAERADAAYQPTDLAAFTASIASVFRSAFERAGLRLEVECRRLPEPVFVDREMWEKIVLNLVSNAFKFTLEGGVEVSVREGEGRALLEVRDTGAGIPPEELPHLFERFHRVRGTRARTHEGTGIGLSLVQELVRLHGGSIAVESVVDEGTAVTVEVPFGSAHLPQAQVRATDPAAAEPTGDTRAFVEEALGTLPAGTPAKPAAPSDPSHRIVLVDDNADMRAYVGRLLAPRWRVDSYADGAAALAAVRAAPPDLVLADVMMPGLDGIELVRELRESDATAATPVILLSARAGEEAAADGLDAGADDYLVKPFGARDLVARVAAHLALAQARRELAAREQARALERQSFLLELSDELRAQSDEEAIGELCTRRLAEHLGLDRCYFATVDPAQERAQIGPEHHRPDLRPIGGELHTADFPEGFRQVQESGLVVEETESDPRLSERDRASLLAIDLAALIVAPLRRGPRDVVWALVAGTAEPRRWTPDERMLLENVAERAWAAIARTRSERAVEAELAGALQLQQVSGELIRDEDSTTLHGLLVDAAVALMDSQAGSMQVFDAERQELRLLAWRGFDDDAVAYWECVLASGHSSCAAALGSGERVVIEDTETFAPLTGTDELLQFRRAGIRSVQSTPLLARDGRLLGMISTHWSAPHAPEERELRLLDVLARQAADVLDRAELVAREQEARREAEQRLEAAAGFTFGGDGMMLVDVGGRVRSWNPAAERITGIAEQSALGRAVGEVLEGWDAIGDRIPVGTAGASDPAAAAALPLQLNGGERWLLISGTRFDRGTVYTFVDVTDERALERLRSEMVATVSHELRTPLAAVYGAAVTLRRDDLDVDESRRDSLLEMIETQSTRLSATIDEILLASRLEAGEVGLALTGTDPVELAREVVDSVAATAPRATLLFIEPATPGTPVDIDGQKVRQVLRNLLENAIRYAGDSGPIEVRVELRDGSLRVSVADQGPGIPEHEQRRIFERFYRVDSNMSDGVGGTGLGLYICRELVRRMHGHVWVESEPGHGSTFNMEVPAGRPL